MSDLDELLSRVPPERLHKVLVNGKPLASKLDNTAEVRMEKPKTKRKPRQMNKTERRYADHLDELKRRGEVLSWQWEAVTLRLAERTTFTPDFLVQYRTYIEIVEIKGRLQDDASVKYKIARDAYPCFRFKMIRWCGLGWKEILARKEQHAASTN